MVCLYIFQFLSEFKDQALSLYLFCWVGCWRLHQEDFFCQFLVCLCAFELVHFLWVHAAWSLYLTQHKIFHVVLQSHKEDCNHTWHSNLHRRLFSSRIRGLWHQGLTFPWLILPSLMSVELLQNFCRWQEEGFRTFGQIWCQS